jgi:hypothetical protein
VSRIDRAFAAVDEAYQRLPADVRVRLHEGIRAASHSLSVADDIPKESRQLATRALMMAVTEGFVGGNWRKVRAAIAEHLPWLWPHVEGILPDGGDGLPL